MFYFFKNFYLSASEYIYDQAFFVIIIADHF